MENSNYDNATKIVTDDIFDKHGIKATRNIVIPPANETIDIHHSITFNVQEDDVLLVKRVSDSVGPHLMAIITERVRQEKKWGPQNHDPLKWNAILGEEFGEVSKAILEGDVKNYREELIQVAAVAIAALESLDRN